MVLPGVGQGENYETSSFFYFFCMALLFNAARGLSSHLLHSSRMEWTLLSVDLGWFRPRGMDQQLVDSKRVCWKLDLQRIFGSSGHCNLSWWKYIYKRSDLFAKRLRSLWRGVAWGVNFPFLVQSQLDILVISISFCMSPAGGILPPSPLSGSADSGRTVKAAKHPKGLALTGMPGMLFACIPPVGYLPTIHETSPHCIA